MILERYLQMIQGHSQQLQNVNPHWGEEIIEPWLEIAPVKAKEYGIECWERLGSRALMVDISACYYRWKQLSRNGQEFDTSPEMANALVDIYGYSTMYCICLSDERHLPPYFHQTFSEPRPSAHELNNWMIEHIWEGDPRTVNRRVLNKSRQVAVNLAMECWRATH